MISRKQKKKEEGGGHACSVSTCTNYYKKTKYSNISYYCFPRNLSLRQVWIAKCRRDGIWNPNTGRICSNHFSDDQFEDDMEARLMKITRPRKLKANAIPTLNIRRSPTPETTRELQSLREASGEVLLRREVPMLNEIEQPGASTSDFTHTIDGIKTGCGIVELDNVKCETYKVEHIKSEAVEVDNIESGTVNVDNIKCEAVEVDNIQCNTCRNLNISSVLWENSRLKEELETLKSYCLVLEQNQEKLKTNMILTEKEKATLQATLEAKEINYRLEMDKFLKSEAITKSLFSQAQLDLLSKKKRVNWEAEDMMRSFTLRYMSKRAYMYVRNTMKIPLPNISSLQRWASQMATTQGTLKELSPE